MNPSAPPDWNAYVDQLSSILDLPIPPECKPGVIANLERTRAIAQLVLEFPLTEQDEVAPVFKPEG